MNPRVRIGRGVVHDLPEVVRAAQRVLVVHGVRSFRVGAAAAVVDSLEADVHCFGGVSPNPSIDQVRAAVALARACSPEVVIGIGGASAMDVAKCVAVLAGCQGDPREALLEPGSIPDRRTATLVQVPTILGSGSELTSFATVYIDQRKHSLDHSSARADDVLIDPDLAATVPAPVAAASALDGLAQAVESAWAVAATTESRALAVSALETLAPVLDDAARRRTFADDGLRTELARGAALAGAAINTSRTTAAHALSYALTAQHGIVHGAAVGLHLRWLIGHNAAATDADTRHPDGAAVLRRLIGDLQQICVDGTGAPIEALVDRLLKLHGVREPCVPRRDWRDDLAGARAANNPRLVCAEDVLAATSPDPTKRRAARVRRH